MTGKKLASTIINVSFEIILVALVVIFLYDFGHKAYSFGYAVFSESAVDNEPGIDKVITIIDGYSDYDIAEILKAKGLIRDENLFWVQMQIFGYKKEVESGEHTLNTSMTSEEMIKVLTNQISGEETEE